MKVSTHNWEDVKKYYHNTYIKVREEGDTIFYVRNVSPDYILLEDTSGEEASIDLSREYELDYILPRKTVFQAGGMAVMLSRIPARKWKKGMSEENTYFLVLHTAGWVQRPFNIHYIESFVKKPTYVSVETALDEFKREGGDFYSAALSPRISLLRTGSVYIDTVLVGKLSKAKKELTCKNIFKDDLAAVFPYKIKTLE